MTVSMQHLLTHQRVLLLQGKMGNFFSRFASFLLQFDIEVQKINFTAGDAFFYHHPQAKSYTGTLSAFSPWLQQYINENQIDAVVCFGDCRPHHLRAARLCKDIGVSFFVFEEGYLRPDYITLQEHGINGYSQLCMEDIQALEKANDKPIYTNNRFYKLSIAAIVYYIVSRAQRSHFPNYEHYRGMTAWQEAAAWLKAPWRKLKKYYPDQRLQQQLTDTYSHQYFLVSLQVHNDSQITHHSSYSDVIEFIEETIISFSKNAKSNQRLVFKHHPLDRGHRDYTSLIAQLAKNHQVSERVSYGCDMHLPTLIKHSIGMITINSTTGLQSIYHKKPTKVMGQAIYNIPKLTDSKSLDEFWQQPEAPDYEFYGRFREYLIEQTQLNGSFYGESPWMQAFSFNKATANSSTLKDTSVALPASQSNRSISHRSS